MARRESVYDYWSQYFRQKGYGDLGAAAVRIARTARDETDFWGQLRETSAYASRFAGNIARAKAGLPMLPEADYVQAESNYRSVLRQYGVPEGYFDDPSDFAEFIENDMSADELGERARMATTLVNSKDPQLLKTFQEYTGLSKGDVIARYMDPDRALPKLQRKFEAVQLGAEAGRAGVDTSEHFNTKLVDLGITQGAAREAYGATARDDDTLDKLASIDRPRNPGHSADELTDQQIAGAKLGVNVKAADRIRKMEGRERARFGGRSSGTAGLGGPGAGSF